MQFYSNCGPQTGFWLSNGLLPIYGNIQKMGVNVYKYYSTLIILYLLKLIVRFDVL